MRWIILFVLFFARTTMAFQFQSIAALSPYMVENLALTLADIGLLIGLYLGPGVIVATLGGTLATWIGDKRTVFASIVLMVLGGIAVAMAPTLGWAITGRVISGAGGVVINVIMTKMVIDWFEGKYTSTALAIFISSWPVGIALCLLSLPALASLGGLSLAWNALITLTVVALILFAVLYRSPPGVTKPAATKIHLTSLPWTPLIYAAGLWGLFNAAIAMVFGFGTLILVERGLSTTAASATASVFLLAIAAAAPAGGWIADRTGRQNMNIAISCIAGIVMFPAILYAPVSTLGVLFCAGGILFGLAPGPIVSMPGKILSAEARTFGTGIYYSLYYAVMMIAPPFAGILADYAGGATVTFVFGSVLSALSLAMLALYQRSVKTLPG